MIRYIILLVIISFVAPQAQAADFFTPTQPTLETIFTHLPKIENSNTKEMVVDYATLAKAFWTEKKCDRLGGNAKKEFIDNLAKATEIVRNRFKKEFDIKVEEAQKNAEIPQMWVLNEVSDQKIQCTNDLNGMMAIVVMQSRNFIKKYQ